MRGVVKYYYRWSVAKSRAIADDEIVSGCSITTSLATQLTNNKNKLALDTHYRWPLSHLLTS